MMDRKLDLERFLQIINWSTYNAPANVGKVYREVEKECTVCSTNMYLLEVFYSRETRVKVDNGLFLVLETLASWFVTTL